jgi:hypothetical protein
MVKQKENKMARDTVKTYDEVLESIGAFNRALERGRRLREQIRSFQTWYYAPELDAVGPGRFIRFKGMTGLEYIREHSELSGRAAEPVLNKWFTSLEENSEEAIFVKQKVSRLLGLYGKTANSGSRFYAPRGWALMGQTKASQLAIVQSEKEPDAVSPQAEVFWQAFLGLSPEDQSGLANRIINRNTLISEKNHSI